jgi:hypothetical protein
MTILWLQVFYVHIRKLKTFYMYLYIITEILLNEQYYFVIQLNSWCLPVHMEVLVRE